ncbi:hypothetical protein, conserved [Plasmodium gonderi]|uniref:mTERF domain-containing protein n=1 Tax=Plasmodium gonderi TaxID=77519 RepID=A0A1Y1J9G8_PLAGO|nr:hypothetical protein, conserved [Plasmodium gonderi]GAW79159.1 hypothetical protein, conserved [Plasmodium gonderi]
MNKYIFFVLVITKFNTFICYVRSVKVIHGSIMRKDKGIIRSKNGEPFFKSPEILRNVGMIKGSYRGRHKGVLFYLIAPSRVSLEDSCSSELTTPSRVFLHLRGPNGWRKSHLFVKTLKYIENLRKVKNIDNTLIGNELQGKEDEIIDGIPDRFLNAFKWALQFRLKNFNCKFMRICKLAKKNNEELKSLENYAIGYKEKLLAMLQNDKDFFMNIVKKLKAKDYFNFDIYSIFKFINLDIRFLFNPECHDESAIFFLIFGNLEKSINYFIQNKDTVDFMQMPKYKNMMNNGEGEKNHLSIQQRKRLNKALRKRKREERQKAYMTMTARESSVEAPSSSIESDVDLSDELTPGVASSPSNEISSGEVDSSSSDNSLLCDVTGGGTSVKGLTEAEGCNTEKRNVKLDISINNIQESSSLEEKFQYFLENYDDIEYFFQNHFETVEEIKSFFEKCHEEENKVKKEEITFNAKGNEIITTNVVVKKGLNLEMIKKIIKVSPRLSLINKNTILKRITHYKNELSYTHDELVHILYNLPQFYAFGNLKRKYKELLYLHETIEEEDLKKFIKKYPRIFTYNVYRTIRPKMLYLIRHLNKNFRDILSFPQYFSYSFRLRIIPRHVAYMNLYYDNYIEYYKELVRKHNYADFNKKFNELVYKPNIPPINLKMLLQTSNKDFMEHYKISYYNFVKSTQLAKYIHNPFILE